MSEAPKGERLAIEDLTDAIIAEYTAQSYTLLFAEDVMRRELANADVLAPDNLPSGITLAEWTAETIPAFFAAYSASFADRPGFPSWTQERWAEWTAGDADFRPDLSWVALAGDNPVGFITNAIDTREEPPAGFIIQVGTRPDWRGRGLGAALVVRALRAWREANVTAVNLDVNVNNPTARRLYERLGFHVVRRRGVFTRDA
jgi:mycothiol synthase